MTTWVALLRGVNVNGVTLRSADLAAVFTGLGFEDVRTILASGNVRFETSAGADGPAALKEKIETALRERFEYDAWILLLTLEELEDAIAGFPFDETDAARHPYVVFCRDGEVRDAVIAAADDLDPDVDPVRPGPGVVYWSVAKGSSTDTAFAKVLARAAYRTTTTTRNLRTLRKITG